MADFGADVPGVRRLLPEVTIDVTSKPSEADVEVWLAEFTGEVARRLGDFSALDAAAEAEVVAAAKRLVHFAVAATVYDAHFPERAGLTDQSYGAVLWDRYTTGLDELADELNPDTGDEGAVEAGAVPLYAFPEPAFPDNLVI